MLRGNGQMIDVVEGDLVLFGINDDFCQVVGLIVFKLLFEMGEILGHFSCFIGNKALFFEGIGKKCQDQKK